MDAAKLLRVPDRVHTKEEMLGLLAKMDFENVVVLIEDADGVWSMTLDGTTSERMNWMIDRVKILLHRI
jgi:hypothetical protein